MKELIWLVPLLPLVGFLLISLGKSYFSKSLAGIIASALVLVRLLFHWVYFLMY